MNIQKIDRKAGARALRTLVASAALTLLAQAGHADAQRADRPKLVVQYADLDLTSASGAKILYRRIHAAAVKVCGIPDLMQLAAVAAAKACSDRAIADAVASIDNPLLTARHRAATGTTDQEGTLRASSRTRP